MPLAGAPLLIIRLALILAMNGASFTGALARWCRDHPAFDYCPRPEDRDMIKAAAATMKLGDVGPCGVPQYNFEMCNRQVISQGVPVMTSVPGLGVAQFDNVPPACMVLASVLSGECTGEGARPVPCGAACMQYQGLSFEQFGVLASYLEAVNGA